MGILIVKLSLIPCFPSDGLSIPFFSLGRRVQSMTRTWSKHHPDAPDAPEWATQTRRVERPEDVIINRDDQMERGETATGEGIFDHTEIEKTRNSTKELVTDSPGTPEKEEVARPDNAPDAVFGKAEAEESVIWQEGRHLVVEHHHLPGEEVSHRGGSFYALTYFQKVQVDILSDGTDDQEKLEIGAQGEESVEFDNVRGETSGSDPIPSLDQPLGKEEEADWKDEGVTSGQRLSPRAPGQILSKDSIERDKAR